MKRRNPNRQNDEHDRVRAQLVRFLNDDTYLIELERDQRRNPDDNACRVDVLTHLEENANAERKLIETLLNHRPNGGR